MANPYPSTLWLKTTHVLTDYDILLRSYFLYYKSHFCFIVMTSQKEALCTKGRHRFDWIISDLCTQLAVFFLGVFFFFLPVRHVYAFFEAQCISGGANNNGSYWVFLFHPVFSRNIMCFLFWKARWGKIIIAGNRSMCFALLLISIASAMLAFFPTAS